MTEPKSEHLVRREHYVTGRQDERERIIALIEEQYPGYENYGWEHITPDDIRIIVALIKGESE